MQRTCEKECIRKPDAFSIKVCLRGDKKKPGSRHNFIIKFIPKCGEIVVENNLHKEIHVQTKKIQA